MTRRPSFCRRAAFVYVDMICTIAIVLLMAALVASYSASSLARARQATCVNNLREIGVALKTYALDYGGAFPADNGLAGLYPMYAADAGILACPDIAGRARMNPDDVQPSRRNATARPVDYAYRPGLFSDDLPYMAIAADFTTRTHRNGANVLYLDGSADFHRFEQERETTAMLHAGELDVPPTQRGRRQ